MNLKPVKAKPAQLITAVILLGVFTALIIMFASGIGKDPHVLESQAIGKTVNESSAQIDLSLPELSTGQPLPPDALPQPPYLINVWGTWCPACHVEHPYLLELGRQIPIIGIDWPADNRSEAEDARKFLASAGNPYHHVLIDQSGRLIIDLGVYGAPETFLIGAGGKILKRYAGPLNAEIWQQEFVPLIK